MIRIVAGKHRSRKLEVPESEAVRPTSDKLRQAIFNILEHRLGTLEDAVVLDACCGTGAMGLEAISRGAAKAFFMDEDSTALNLARKNAGSLGEKERSSFVLSDAMNPPRGDAVDLIFLDPPYNKQIAERALLALSRMGWVKKGTFAAVEVAAAEAFTPSEGWEVLLERKHGAGRLVLLEYK